MNWGKWVKIVKHFWHWLIWYFYHRSDKEAFLAKISRDNVQLLINQIFQLPTAKVDNEIVIKLPPGTTRLPRAKPVPKAKELTKWEKYAKEKGITKRKKANTEWDEELNVNIMIFFSGYF